LHEQDEIVYVCRDIISQGVEIIITSLGENGALLITKDEVLYSRPPEVSALNPAGSGDSMVAGLAVGMSRGYPLKETFRLGMACGVANTLHTEVGLVDIETVKELLCEIDIITL
jgi:tagatose 6-phosphate kinase